jgi:ParB-like nuclease domain
MNNITTPPDATHDQLYPFQQLRGPIVNVIESKPRPSSILIQDLPIGQIAIPLGQRPIRNLTGLVASIQRAGLIYPATVTLIDSHYWLIDGWLRMNAYIPLGWSVIPAIVLSVDEQRAELVSIDANLMRGELTSEERDELRRSRKELCRTIYQQQKRRHSPGAGHGKEQRAEGTVPAADTPSKTEPTRLTILPPAPADTDGRDGRGDGRASSSDPDPAGSEAPEAFIPRLITRLFRIQDSQHGPAGSSQARDRLAPKEVRLKGERRQGQLNRGGTPRKVQSNA